MDANWVADGLAQFLRSPMWTTPVSNFVDDNCIYFDSDVEMKLEYTPIHQQFQQLVDALLTGYIGELGVSAEDALEVIKASADPTHMRLVEYLTYLDDFASFKKLMEKRNAELEYEALKQLNMAAAAAAPIAAEPNNKPSGDEPDEEFTAAVAESQMMAELIMKEAEMEDLELQKALALSLAMEQERILREQEAQEKAAAAAPAPAPAPATPVKVAEAPAKSIESISQENMEARVKNLEEANKKIAQLQVASPVKVAPPTAAPTTAPAVVRLTAETPASTGVSAGGLAPIGRKPIADPTAFKALPPISFKQLQNTAAPTAAPTATSAPEPKGPSLAEMQRRAEELKKQRDLIIAMKKKERNEELQAATGQSAPQTATRDEELARQKQMAVEIARRFRDDIVGESRK